MAFEQEQRAALRILEGIEEGTMSASESHGIVEDANPALIYLLFTWLRKRYADHPNSDAVIGRLAEVSNRGSVPAQMKEGHDDPVARWFEEGHSYKDYGSKEFVELIVEKLEG